MFLLDTNVVSELRKIVSGRAAAPVNAWAARHPMDAFFLSSVTIMELEQGVLRKARTDEQQAATLRRWLQDEVLPQFANRILPFDIPAALRCAALHVPDPRPERDAMIAATALVHGLTVVTRNTADFASTGVPLLNPWQPPPAAPP